MPSVALVQSILVDDFRSHKPKHNRQSANLSTAKIILFLFIDWLRSADILDTVTSANNNNIAFSLAPDAGVTINVRKRCALPVHTGGVFYI